jgi:hypothetical protein
MLAMSRTTTSTLPANPIMDAYLKSEHHRMDMEAKLKYLEMYAKEKDKLK